MIEDMEIKGWVVRTNVNARPAWLKQEQIKGGNPLFDVSENERDAHVFDNYDDAETVANVWSDFPGVWYVERL